MRAFSLFLMFVGLCSVASSARGFVFPDSYHDLGVNDPVDDKDNSQGSFRESMQSMQTTCYMDGSSCPGGCDSHVVFSPSRHNSSHDTRRNAYAAGTRFQPEPCRLGKACTICFSEDPDDCLTTTFRGSGPAVGRFDVTPTFLHRHCFQEGTLDLREDVPLGLRSVCTYISHQAKRLEEKVNCIANPQHPNCEEFMRDQISRREKDLVKYQECLSVGEAQFNKGKSLFEQRTYNCAYRKISTDHAGKLWKDLLPGACQAGTFVSPRGLDCCAADTLTSACSGDCQGFFR